MKLNFIELTNKPRKEVAKAHFRIIKRGHFYSGLTQKLFSLALKNRKRYNVRL
ncbi:hypothetical protein HMPREF9554_01842 [Treponema phagedenis F0421]|nr:hypothetical protein HMPREF9554_01842 [Treponema phagedenis F0421]